MTHSISQQDQVADTFRELQKAVEGEIKLRAFISYSRRNQEFVDKLAKAFEAHGQKVWIDRKDIQHTEEWLRAIYSGIEAAENFIFIISEHSVTSENCLREVKHADRYEKRIIPVLYRTPQSAVPTEVDKYQRLEFSDNDDFDTRFKALLEAIDADPEHISAHTWLTLRAREWEKDRKPDFLLRGEALRRAKDWLSGLTPDKKPGPSKLQQEFVASSVSLATRRTLTALGIAALVLLILSGITAWAINRTREARRQRTEILSRQLFNTARSHYQDDFDLALLLTLEAGVVADTPNAQSNLLEALQQYPRLVAVLGQHTSGINSLAYSMDGKLIASSAGDQKVVLWDAGTHKPDGQPLVHEFAVTTLAFGNKSQTLAVSDTNQIVLWDVALRKPRGPTLKVAKGSIDRISLSPDERILASCGGFGTVSFWDTTTSQPMGEAWDLQTMVKTLAFSPDGQLLAIAAWDRITLWNFKDRKLIRTLEGVHTGTVNDIAFTPDSKLLASASNDNTIVFWDVASGLPDGSRLEGHTGGVNSIGFNSDGKYLISGSDDGEVRVWSVETRKQIISPLAVSRRGITRVAADTQHTQVVAAGDIDGNIFLWDTYPQSSHNAPQITRPLFGNEPADELTFSPNGQLLAVGYQNNQTMLYDMTKPQAEGIQLEQDRSVTALAFSADGKILASGSSEHTVTLWEVSEHKLLRRLDMNEGGSVTSIVFLPKQNILAISLSGRSAGRTPLTGFAPAVPSKIFFFDLNNYSLLGEPIVAEEESVTALAVTPDNNILIAGLSNGEIRFFNAQDRREIKEPVKNTDSSIYDLAFNFDGSLMAAATGDATVLLCDIKNGTFAIQPVLAGHREIVKSVAFSPDGRLLASGSQDGTVILWDVATRQKIGLPLAGHSFPIESIAFSPDGRVLASAGQDGLTNLWSVSLSDWKKRACAIANRDLTKAEWRQHLGDEPYRATCSKF